MPYRAKAVEAALARDGRVAGGGRGRRRARDRRRRRSTATSTPTATYRTQMAVVYTRRAIEAALGRSA